MYSNLNIKAAGCPTPQTVKQKSSATNPIANKQITNIAFKGANWHHTISMRTCLNTKEEQQKYNDIVRSTTPGNREILNYFLKTGRLLNNTSNDKSTVLDNLHKIISSPRAEGLNPKVVLDETIKALAYPTTINQRFGDIPAKYHKDLGGKDVNNPNDNLIRERISQEIDYPHLVSSTCAATSIEFNLANNMPAEFARMAADLSSENMAVKKVINLKSINESSEVAKEILDIFKTDYKILDNGKAEITLKPDKYAIIRARIQAGEDKDENERSAVDVLIQSTIMNAASQNTYNSLTDLRIKGEQCNGPRGISSIEANHVQSILNENEQYSISFQEYDTANTRIINKCSAQELTQSLVHQLTNQGSLVCGHSFVVEQDGQPQYAGHEIVLLDIKQDKEGKIWFAYKDPMKTSVEPDYMSQDEFCKKLHHVIVPKTAIDDDKLIKKLYDQEQAEIQAQMDKEAA